jgi:hypothetical protein
MNDWLFPCNSELVLLSPTHLQSNKKPIEPISTEAFCHPDSPTIICLPAMDKSPSTSWSSGLA